MTAPHLLARVKGADSDLAERLASTTIYPNDIAGAITATIDARLDVLRAELHLRTSDEQEDDARAEEEQAIREGIEIADDLLGDTSLALGSDRAKLATAVKILARRCGR